jgi:hypothetical protein
MMGMYGKIKILSTPVNQLILLGRYIGTDGYMRPVYNLQ